MPTLMGHAVLIMQAIDNLISNAIKYTPDGGQIAVSTGGGEHAVVRVSDTGYGIPADKLDAIRAVRARRPAHGAHLQHRPGPEPGQDFRRGAWGYVSVQSARRGAVRDSPARETSGSASPAAQAVRQLICRWSPTACRWPGGAL